MKKIILCMFVLFFVPSVLGLDITREFSNNSILTGQETIVKLIVTVSPGDEVYVIEEDVPAGISVADSGNGSFSNGKMLWVVMSDLQDIEYTYTISGDSEGNYLFAGIYSVNGENETTISGENSLTIEESTTTPTPTPTPDDGDGGNGNGGNGGGGDTTPPDNNSTTPNDASTDLTGDNSDNQTQDTNTSIGTEVPGPGEEEKSKSIFWMIVMVVIVVIVVMVTLVIILAVIIQNKRMNKTSSL